ncbi:unnamed protein product [Closterium sp. Naga37s-1]|nr:unnamed protein product [Closterium sp. Naga37s-1]
MASMKLASSSSIALLVLIAASALFPSGCLAQSTTMNANFTTNFFGGYLRVDVGPNRNQIRVQANLPDWIKSVTPKQEYIVEKYTLPPSFSSLTDVKHIIMSFSPSSCYPIYNTTNVAAEQAVPAYLASGSDICLSCYVYLTFSFLDEATASQIGSICTETDNGMLRGYICSTDEGAEVTVAQAFGSPPVVNGGRTSVGFLYTEMFVRQPAGSTMRLPSVQVDPLAIKGIGYIMVPSKGPTPLPGAFDAMPFIAGNNSKAVGVGLVFPITLVTQASLATTPFSSNTVQTVTPTAFPALSMSATANQSLTLNASVMPPAAPGAAAASYNLSFYIGKDVGASFVTFESTQKSPLLFPLFSLPPCPPASPLLPASLPLCLLSSPCTTSLFVHDNDKVLLKVGRDSRCGGSQGAQGNAGTTSLFVHDNDKVLLKVGRTRARGPATCSSIPLIFPFHSDPTFTSHFSPPLPLILLMRCGYFTVWARAGEGARGEKATRRADASSEEQESTRGLIRGASNIVRGEQESNHSPSSTRIASHDGRRVIRGGLPLLTPEQQSEDFLTVKYSHPMTADASSEEDCHFVQHWLVRAGARPRIYFKPQDVRAAVVTCGGLCPGLNDVIRQVVMTLNTYGVGDIRGIKYGFRGFFDSSLHIPLNRAVVDNIHLMGGSFLGVSRGGSDSLDIVDSIQKEGINMLFVIGGNGTHAGALAIHKECYKRGMKVAVVGVPKTIDNDILLLDQTFGFDTAVEEAQRALHAAYVEASSAYRGIGIVKLMGRQSGFIAMHSSLASGQVDMALIPEVPFCLEGPNGVLQHLEYLLDRQGHAIICVAEGAGQDLVQGEGGTDASGNPILSDIGVFLLKQVRRHFKSIGRPADVKYIDPTYMIRACRANASDSVMCAVLGQNAVHGAFAGYSGITVGLVNSHYAYIPIPEVIRHARPVDPNGRMWHRCLTATGQPDFIRVQQ